MSRKLATAPGSTPGFNRETGEARARLQSGSTAAARGVAGFGFALALGLALSLPAVAQQRVCMPDNLTRAMLSAEAERIGGRVETLTEPGEVKRYIEVINEEPPKAGPAERLVILVHPQLGVARVFLVHEGLVCERYLIGRELHRKAWTAARGMAT